MLTLSPQHTFQSPSPVSPLLSLSPQRQVLLKTSPWPPVPPAAHLFNSQYLPPVGLMCSHTQVLLTLRLRHLPSKLGRAWPWEGMSMGWDARNKTRLCKNGNVMALRKPHQILTAEEQIFSIWRVLHFIISATHLSYVYRASLPPPGWVVPWLSITRGLRALVYIGCMGP